MSDYLLRGLKEIHQELFTGKDGRPVIALSTFRQKTIMSGGTEIRMVQDMRRLGVLFYINLGRAKRRTLCGWQSLLMRYLMAFHRAEYKDEHPDALEP
jgi:hypothetical protein